MTDLVAIIVFIFGLTVGSFLNSVIYRLDQLDSILVERSVCPRCKKKLSWWELVPVVSYLLLRGKCYGCKKPISIQYPLVELVTAALFFLIYVHFGLTIQALVLAAVGALLVVAATYDLLHFLVPDEALVPAMALTILFPLGSAIFDWFAHSTNTFGQLFTVLLGGVIGAGALGILVALGRGKWMGDGDIRVGLVMGLLLGYPLILPALFIAFVSGAAVSLGLLVFRRANMKDAVPFAPFLVFGTFVALFWGQELINWYLRLTF